MNQNLYSSKTIGAALATVYCFYYAVTTAQWHFIDNANLVIHEAGHTLFMFFGQFLYVFMGSGFQILFPFTFATYFFVKEAKYSASIMMMWVGINILNVSVYAGDAQRMQLELIGGEHDWTWLFSELGVLNYTTSIAACIFFAGIVVLSFASAGALYFAKEND